MLIEQIIEIELRGLGPLDRKCTPVNVLKCSPVTPVNVQMYSCNWLTS